MTNFENNAENTNAQEYINHGNDLLTNLDNRLANTVKYAEQVDLEIDSQDMDLLMKIFENSDQLQEMCIDRCNAYLA